MINKYIHKVDLCVIGGGLAGMCCAIAAARQGLSVAIMQERPVFGGNASSEIRMWVCGAQGENNRETGIIEEICLENLYYNADKKYPLWDNILFNKVKSEKNIQVFLNCTCFEASTDNNRIKSVMGYQMTTQSFIVVEAKYFADCSGDSITTRLTNADYRIGRENPKEFYEDASYDKGDNQTMGNSCLIQARKTDRKTAFVPPPNIRRVTKEEIESRGLNMESSCENFWYLELGGDRTIIKECESIRDDLIELALGVWDYIKNSGNVKDSEYWELEFLGFLPGKRESRRMVGKYIMTQRDIADNRQFEDCVAYGGWPLDDHLPNGFNHKGERYYIQANTPSPYQIPYRCLYSNNIENLYFAGRNISMTHQAMSSARVMATCALLGEAVGTACAVANKYGLTPHGVYEQKISEVQELLMLNGCFLPYCKRTVSDNVKKATLSGGTCLNLENLRNGIDRNNHTYGEKENGAFIPVGTVVDYSMISTFVENAHIAFDSDLDRKTLNGDWCERTHAMRCNFISNEKCPTMNMPKTLVKDFELILTHENGDTERVCVENNLKQTVNIPIGKKLIGIGLKINSLWSEEKNAHVFSFDFN